MIVGKIHEKTRNKIYQTNLTMRYVFAKHTYALPSGKCPLTLTHLQKLLRDEIYVSLPGKTNMRNGFAFSNLCPPPPSLRVHFWLRSRFVQHQTDTGEKKPCCE